MMALSDRLDNYVKEVEELEEQQKINFKARQNLVKSLENIVDQSKLCQDELDLCSESIEILRMVSDTSVSESYEFITKAVNSALARCFKNVRQIYLKEYTKGGQYPQLELVLKVQGGKERSLKLNSGHGLTQVISILCVLSLIVITKSRRLLVLDEALSGLSGRTRKLIGDILWNFTQIGFQFIINEHGLAFKGSHVIHMVNENDVGRIENEYIETKGQYLSSDIQYEH